MQVPILKENLGRYPKDWKVISQRIRFDRAGGQCEFISEGIRCLAKHGEPHPLTGSKVILTVAHLDHTPENCEDDNLLAGCQRCHNRHDRAHRNETRSTRIRSTKGTELFAEASRG